MIALKQSTAITLKFGPFVDEDDGKTAEAGLTITQPDVRLSKNGANIAQKNAAGTASHDELGFYDISLDATDTDTLGRLLVAVHESGALPVFQYFMVLNSYVWDSLYGTDLQQVDVVQWGGVAPSSLVGGKVQVDVRALDGDEVAADNLEADYDGTGYDKSASKIGEASSLGTQAKADVNAEADTALSDYDPPTKTEMDTGHGLLATVAKQDAIDAIVDAIRAVTDLLPDSGALSDLTIIKVVVSTRLPGSLTGGRMKSYVGAVADDAISDAGVSSDLDSYQAKVWVIDDDASGNDRYMFAFFKNGKQITSGVTVPTMWVYNAAASPANLIGTSGSPQSLTEAGATETWFHNEGSDRLVDGAAYFARVRFTVDGSEREWTQPIGRDSA